MLKDIKTAIKNSMIYGIGNLSSKLVGFILIPMYVKHLSVSDYGTLSVLEISAQLIIAVFGFALYQGFNRWYWDPEIKDRQKGLFFTSLITLAAITGLMVCSLASLSTQISSFLFHTPKFAGVLRLMICASALQILVVLPMTLMKLQSRSVLYTVSSLIQFTVNLATTIYFITVLNQNIEAIYRAQIIGLVVFLGINLKYILKNIKIKFESRVLIEMLGFSFPLMLSSISGIIFTIADRFCINYITGLAALGAYSLGYKIANSIKVILIMSVQLALNPMIYQMMSQPNNKRFYSKIMTYFSFGVQICVLGLSMFSREFVHLLAHSNPDYWDAQMVIPILSFSILFGMLKDTAVIGLNLTKKTKIIGTVTIVLSLINIGFNAVFIYLLGSIGASIAALLSNLIFFLIIYHFAQKSYYIPYEMKKIATMILLAVLIYGISLINIPIPPILKIIIKVVLLVLLPVLLYLVGFYEKVEISVIKGAWRKWRNPLHWIKNFSKIKIDK